MKRLFILFSILFSISFLSLSSLSLAANPCFLTGPSALSDTSGTVGTTDPVSIVGYAAYCSGCDLSAYGDPAYLSPTTGPSPDPINTNSSTQIKVTYTCHTPGTNILLKLVARACPYAEPADAGDVIETRVTCNAGAAECSPPTDYVAGECDGAAYGVDCNSAERIYTSAKCKMAKCVVDDVCKQTTMLQCKFTLYSSDATGTVGTDTVSVTGQAVDCAGFYISPSGTPTSVLSFNSKTSTTVQTALVTATYNCVGAGTGNLFIQLRDERTTSPTYGQKVDLPITTVTCNAGPCDTSKCTWTSGACGGAAYSTSCNPSERIYSCPECSLAKCQADSTCGAVTQLPRCSETCSSKTGYYSTGYCTRYSCASGDTPIYYSPTGGLNTIYSDCTTEDIYCCCTPLTVTCKSSGQSCTYSTDCCSGLSCINKVCSSPTTAQAVTSTTGCSVSYYQTDAGGIVGSTDTVKIVVKATNCNGYYVSPYGDPSYLSFSSKSPSDGKITTSGTQYVTIIYSCANARSNINFYAQVRNDQTGDKVTLPSINVNCAGTTTSAGCTDTDVNQEYFKSQDYWKRGAATNKFGTFTDSCSSNGLACPGPNCIVHGSWNGENLKFVDEFYCESDGRIEAISYECHYGCKDGACIKKPCEDSDGGRNIYVKGTTTGIDIDGTDYCIDSSGTSASEGKRLSELYCSDGKFKVEIIDCPNGCKDGACVAVATSGTVTATKGQTYGNYIFYAVTGANNNWALIRANDKTGAVIEQQTISQNDVKDFAKIGVRVKVLAVDALPDGTVRGVVIEISPITKTETGMATLTSPVEYGDYRIYTKSGVTNSWVLLIIEDKNGREIDTFTINQGETKDSSFAPLRIKLIRVARTQGGELVNADLEVSEIPQEATEKPKVKCTDTDLGKNYYKKGSGTGMYAGSSPPGGHIFGEDPNKASIRISEEYNYDIAYDHCEDSATSNELNEVFCDSEGRLQIEAYSCPRGCKDGVCLGKTISERIGETVFSIIGQRAAPTTTQETVSVQMECMPGVSKCVVKDRRIVKNNPELFFYKCGNDGKWEITECFRPTIQFLTNTYTTYETCNPVVGCMSMIEYDRLVFDLENIMYQTSENKKKLRKCDECNPNDFACVCGDVDKADIENIQIKPGYWCKDGKSSENRLEVGCEPQGVLNYDVKEYCAGSGGECVEEGLPGFKKYTYKQCVEGKLNTIRCSGKCKINLGCVEGSETTTIPTGAFISILGKSS